MTTPVVHVVDHLRYVLHEKNDGVVLVGSDQLFPDLVIPSHVMIEGKLLPVLEIGKRSFECQDVVESVIIPSTVRLIGGAAFESNKNLTHVEFAPNSELAAIGPGAFTRSTALRDVTLPQTLRDLQAWAFKNCSALATVTLLSPCSLLTIGDSCFEGDSLESFDLPRSVREIQDRAFHQNQRLAHFGIPPDSELEVIGSGAFCDTALREFTLPPRVVDLGSWVFLDCTFFETLTFQPRQQIRHIGCWLCQGTSLRSIAIPSAVETIEVGAFDGLDTLSQVIFPEDSRLVRIASRAFARTNIQGHISLPASLCQLELDVFKGCKHVKSLSLPLNSKLEDLYRGVFEESGAVSLILPTIRNLADKVFFGCPALRSVRFVVPEQGKEQRMRKMRIPSELFDAEAAYVIYPEGALKNIRQKLNASIIDDFI